MDQVRQRTTEMLPPVRSSGVQYLGPPSTASGDKAFSHQNADGLPCRNPTDPEVRHQPSFGGQVASYGDLTGKDCSSQQIGQLMIKRQRRGGIQDLSKQFITPSQKRVKAQNSAHLS
jgi:hypothetical protein